MKKCLIHKFLLLSIASILSATAMHDQPFTFTNPFQGSLKKARDYVVSGAYVQAWMIKNAIALKNVELCAVLLEGNSGAVAQDALKTALYHDVPEIVHYLIKLKGVNPNYLDPATGDAPVHMALYLSHHACLDALLEYPIDFNLKNRMGHTSYTLVQQQGLPLSILNK
jgi:ankyrin repeat protein